MSAQPLAASVIVLDRSPSGDNWHRLVCFSVEHGNLDCLQRISRRAAATAPLLDLFDEAEISLESRNEGRTWFVRETAPTRRRTALAASYAAFEKACRFARVLARNPVPDESRAAVRALLGRALDAWETGVRPEAVYFKSLFVVARDEGYPVREEWMRDLAGKDRTTVDDILRLPAAAQTATEMDVVRLTAAFEHYLKHSTEIRIDTA